MFFLKTKAGTSLVVQWLRLRFYCGVGVQVRSLIRELPWPKKKKKANNNKLKIGKANSTDFRVMLSDTITMKQSKTHTRVQAHKTVLYL